MLLRKGAVGEVSALKWRGNVGAWAYRAVAAVDQLHFHIGAGSIQGSRSCARIIQGVHGPLQHHARAPVEVLHQVIERSRRGQVEDRSAQLPDIIFF